MKVLVLGGVSVPPDHPAQSAHLGTLRDSMSRVGRSLMRRDHDLLVCSPYPGSADCDAVLGAAEILHERKGALVEFHTPGLPKIKEELNHLLESLPQDRVKTFYHPVSADENGEPELTYTWLLAQLSAMGHCDVVLALGGRLNGAASLLLPVAESQSKPILPLDFLGGAAQQSFERRRYELTSRLGDRVTLLQDASRIEEAVALIEDLPKLLTYRPRPSIPLRVFLSYPRARTMEADNVEMILRRNNCEVYRDEVNFGAGRSITGEIKNNIHRSNVFVAIWCQEYACSPWCFDELDLALDLHGEGGLALWMLRVDDTRVIPPRARDLTTYRIDTRDALEGTLLKQIIRIQDESKDTSGT